jgi:hypothetical protein
MNIKNDVIQGTGYVDINDIPWGQANSTGVPPDQMNLRYASVCANLT